MRRQAEDLRARRLGSYDGGRDAAAYRTAAAALANTGTTVDTAATFLGSVERWTEAAALVDRTGAHLTTPRAMLAVARGYLSRGEVAEAAALAAAVPCSELHDPDLTLAFTALLGRAYRPGDAQCGRPLPQGAAPFDGAEGSFELGRWGRWRATGGSFARGPTHTLPSGETFVNGWRGRYYANSWGRGDVSTGTLRSRPFVINTDGISFLVGGGADTSRVGVRLMVDGVAVVRTAGADSEALKRSFWDVRPWRGRTATIEVYDDATEGWGHILADDFRAEPVLPAP